MQLVVARVADRRPKTYRVKKSPDGGLIGVVPDHTQYSPDRETVLLKGSDVMVYLPEDAPYGKVYGALVEPVRSRWMVKGWGAVYDHLGCRDDVRARISKSLILGKRKIEQMYEGGASHDILTLVKTNVGRVVGTYGYRPNDVDQLTLRPPEAMGTRELTKTVVHELSHGVWFRIMTPEERAKWIQTYMRYVTVEVVSVSDVKKMVRSIRQIASLRDYLHDCEAEEAVGAAIYVGWLKKVHKLDKREVQDLVSSGNDLPVPDVHLHRSDVDTPVTLYSKSTADEMFCEAVSSHAVGDLSDERLQALIERR